MPTWIKQTESQVEIQSNDPSVIGVHNFKFTATEVNQGLVDSTVGFKVTINCQTQNLKPVITGSTVTSQQYELRGSKVSFTMPNYTWEPLSCNCELTYSLES